MYRALSHCFETLHSPLTVGSIIELHTRALGNVTTIDGTNSAWSPRKRFRGFRLSSTGFRLHGSKEGMGELRHAMQYGKLKGWASEITMQGKPTMCLSHKTKKVCKKKLQEMLLILNVRLRQHSRAHEKLEAIVSFTTEFNRRHFFEDGKIRVTWLLLNKLLMKIGITAA